MFEELNVVGNTKNTQTHFRISTETMSGRSRSKLF